MARMEKMEKSIMSNTPTPRTDAETLIRNSQFVFGRSMNRDDVSANFARQLEQELDEARAKQAGMTCEVCWTSSYEPCTATDKGAEPYKDGSGYVCCAMCNIREFLVGMTAERDQLKATLANIEKGESHLMQVIDERDQLRLDIAEIRRQHDQESQEWKTDEEVTAERDKLRKELENLNLPV